MAHPGLAEATLPQGVPLKLTLAAAAGFGAAWLAATGNADHFRALADLAREHHLELTPQGLWAEAFSSPPGKRTTFTGVWDYPHTAGVAGGHRRGRGRAAEPLPRLITPEDIRGCFHVHSYYSDGVNSLEELIIAAKQRGWSYLGLSDHSQSAYYAGGLKAPDLERQRAEVAARGGNIPISPCSGGWNRIS